MRTISRRPPIQGRRLSLNLEPQMTYVHMLPVVGPLAKSVGTSEPVNHLTFPSTHNKLFTHHHKLGIKPPQKQRWWGLPILLQAMEIDSQLSSSATRRQPPRGPWSLHHLGTLRITGCATGTLETSRPTSPWTLTSPAMSGRDSRTPAP